LARRLLQLCTSATAEAVASEGLKAGEFAVLVYLSRVTGEPGIDQNGLAARLGVERARVSQLVDELEKRGLVDRRVNGADRRARQLRLTPRGEQLRARLHPKSNAIQMGILASLTPSERELLLDLLVRVVESNRATSATGQKPRPRPSPSSNRPPSPSKRT
jgi:DNA-binding MarR family transcriptional regulator